MDVDHFKPINDGHGHAGGDRVLSALGALLRDQAMYAAKLAGRNCVVVSSWQPRLVAAPATPAAI